MPNPITRGLQWVSAVLAKYVVRDSSGTERAVFDTDGYLYQLGTKLTAAAGALNGVDAMYANQGISALNGSAGQKACRVNGLSVIAGGTGIADMTLAAPTVGARAVIRIGSLTSGNVVVTCAAGVTFNGTNNTATFNAAEDTLVLVYKAANTWEVELNNSVVLTTV